MVICKPKNGYCHTKRTKTTKENRRLSEPICMPAEYNASRQKRVWLLCVLCAFVRGSLNMILY